MPAKTKVLAPAPTPKVEPVVFPWERLPGESVQAYSRFVAYRNTPAADRAYRKLGLSLSLVSRWAARHAWSSRTAQYDDWLFSLRDEVSEAASLRHRSKAARFADRALDKATLAVEALDPGKMASGTAVELARAGSDLGRLAHAISHAPQAASSGFAGVGVVWGGEHPPWLASSPKANPNETELAEPTQPLNKRQRNGRVKVLAKDTPAALGVHARPAIEAEIVRVPGTIKEKD